MHQLPDHPSEPLWRTWASAPQPEALQEAEELSLLILQLGALWLALPTDVCKEVAEKRAVHTLPHRKARPPLGLVNIRGELHLCLALSPFLGLEATSDTEAPPYHTGAQRLLVTEYAAERWVFLVDIVHGIQHFAKRTLHEGTPPTVPAMLALAAAGSIAWQGSQVIVLDAERFFAVLRRDIL